MNNQNWNPQHPQPAQQMPPIPQSKSGMAIAGFVLGIIALLTSFLPIINNFSFFLAILGMIFGIVGMVGIMKGKKSGKGLAIAAIVICVVSGVVVLGTQSMYSGALDVQPLLQLPLQQVLLPLQTPSRRRRLTLLPEHLQLQILRCLPNIAMLLRRLSNIAI